MEMFAYRLRKYIGAYLAALGGADAVVFTGGIGEKDVLVREKACAGLERLGIRLDREANRAAFGVRARISAPDSPVQLLVIPTNEELEMAREAEAVVRNGSSDRSVGLAGSIGSA
jgi:acetate kinase